MSSTRYSITSDAYTKILFHLLKYPYAQVNGILLGSKDGDTVAMSDAVALFHSSTLSPMLEIAMMQIDEYAQKSKKEIIGYYIAKESNTSRHPDSVDAKIATKIQSACPHACLLMVDPTLINPSLRKLCTKILFKRGDDWRSVGEVSLTLAEGDAVFDKLSEAVQQRAYLSLHDFDNHLENNNVDWFNANIKL